MNTAKNASWLCVALIAVSAFCWYQARSKPHHQRLDEQTLSTTPDQQITRLTVHQFDATGRLIHQLTAPFMHHIPSQNKHWLKNPLIMITELHQPAWDIQSKEATSLTGFERITFQHDVLIHHAAYEKNQAGTISTDEISYIPNQKLATTDGDITWIQAGNAMHSTGMNAYLAELRIDLLHNPRATYEPMHG